MPLAKLKPKGQITIPKPIRDKLGLSAGDLVDIHVEAGKAVIMPQRLVAAAPTAKLSAKEQRALTRARKKIAAINDDWVNSKGLTRDEVDVAAKAGLIDPEQKYWWTEEWQEGEREVERNYQKGEFEVFDSKEEFLASLKPL